MSEEKRRKESVAGLYNRAAATFDRVGPRHFAAFGRRLVELAELPEGARVLDIGVGRGAVLFPAVEHASAAGYVVGVDLAAEMLSETSRECKMRGLDNAGLVELDAERLAFREAAFDFALGSFVIFFLPHLVEALAGFGRVLRPGGQIGLAMTNRADPRWQWYDDLLRAYDQKHHFMVDEGPSVNRKPDRLIRALEEARFRTVRRVDEEYEFFYRDEEEWWASLWTHGSRRPLDAMPPEVLQAFRAEALAGARANQEERGIPQEWPVSYFFGTK